MVLQYDRTEYEADMERLEEMSRDEVVAMLRRNAHSFSRCALARPVRAHRAHGASATCSYVTCVH